MNDLRDSTTARPVGAVSTAALFMQQVYTWMAAALGVTAVAAYVTMHIPSLVMFVAQGAGALVFGLGLLAMVFFISARIHTMSAGGATGAFLLYAGLMGIFLSPLGYIYAGADIAQAFIVTAGMFAGMSVFGWVTKRDLSGMGSFMMMGLIGIIIASIVNIFLQNGMMSFVISVIGVIVFAGLTAWDTQKLKAMGETAPMDDATAIRRGSILGALTLYLDFLNMFLFLLRLLGNRD